MLSTWNVQILTVEFAVDLDNDLGWGQVTVPCFSTVADVFHLKVHWAEVRSRFVHVR